MYLGHLNGNVENDKKIPRITSSEKPPNVDTISIYNEDDDVVLSD
jgi:hypothetical protein